MKIEIRKEVANNKKWHPILDIISVLVFDKIHSFDSSKGFQLLQSDWARSNRRNYDLVRLSTTVRSTDALTDATLVIVDENSRRGGLATLAQNTTIIHPLDAIQFLFTPFQVILENEEFDGAFLLWMAKALGFSKFNDAYRDRRFVFRHAGGKGSIKRSAIIFSHGVWSRKDQKHSRAFALWMCVVLDNDSKYPTNRPNNQIIDDVRPHVAFVYELKKRAIESYIPCEKLLKLDSSKSFYRKVKALSGLTSIQKNHYHMKKGFSFSKDIEPNKKNFFSSELVTQEEKELYNSIDDLSWLELMNGFGTSLSKIYSEEKYRPEPNDSQMTDFLGNEEILNLLKKIYSRI